MRGHVDRYMIEEVVLGFSILYGLLKLQPQQRKLGADPTLIHTRESLLLQ
ncbi:hypothetical protein SDC9_210578 [bioreactor metagenome]|uniref:Uncharacterized protein n=1 Tax=bioreactor metagenome TaxID=1076179 RepID=A0A645JGM2_9ZZZZ